MPASTVPDTGWDVVLRDGSTMHVRSATPADAPAIRTFFLALSPESRHQRFLAACKPDAVSLPDLDSTRAPTCFTIVAETRGVVFGVANYVRHPQDERVAECAVVIGDALQGRGLGTRLVELLAETARAAEIETFTADTLYGNDRMMDVFRDSGFPVAIDHRSGTSVVRIEIADAAANERRRFDRARQATAASLRPIFEPRRVAVVGAGRHGGVGAAVFGNLRARFTGDVIPVNPRAEACDGVAAYARLEDIPGTIDLVVVAVPAASVRAVVDSAIAAKVGGLVVISAGFAESGPEGRAAQDRLLERVRDAGIRMVGPNCLGILNTDRSVGLDATFSPVFPPEGSVAMCTQSGALGLAILDCARQLGLGISSFASIGNKADVSSNDLLQYWAGDARTRLILLYLESFGNPRAFTRIARRISRDKPIIAIKAGRSHSGQRAASSHTGALASSDVIVAGLFEQAGVIRVDTLEEMFDLAALMSRQGVPTGRRLGILTNAGGAAILAADAAEAGGLAVPELGSETIAALRTALPAAANVGNPVDMLASATADDYGRSLRVMLADPGIDSVLAIYVPPLVTSPAEVAAVIADVATGASDKPVAAVFMQADAAPVELGTVPAFRFPESAARALALAAGYGAWRRRPDTAAAPMRLDKTAQAVLDRAMATGGGWLSTPDVEEVLSAAGIAVVHSVVAADAFAAIAAAGAIGYPVALKAVGATILHKSDVGGVRLDLRNDSAVAEAAAIMQRSLGGRLTGFLVQPAVAAGVELLVGTVEDPSFGPVVLCSLGGTLVELLNSPIARLAPLSSEDIDALIDGMPGSAILGGYRGSPPADRAAIADLLRRVSALVTRCPEILEMDLNPVRVLSHGLAIVDARIRVGAPPVTSGRRLAY
jgi:acetyl coenzyme A synthetase (ADP forming)-like protein